MTRLNLFTARKEISLLALISALLFVESAFAQNPAPVRVCIEGIANPVHIGDLSWGTRNRRDGRGHLIEAQFTFRPGWGHLDNHDRYDFRWFQIVKRVRNAELPRWNNNGNWVLPNTPFVDPAPGGWDYNDNGVIDPDERADHSPYYEDDPGFGGDFDFNNWHTPGVNSEFQDAPINEIGAEIHFQTFLVVVLNGRNTFQLGQRNFLKLIAFDWTMQVLNRGTQQNPVKWVQITPSANPINMNEKKQDITNALNGTGFAGWRALNEGCLVPEPASMTALGVGLLALLSRRRRRKA